MKYIKPISYVFMAATFLMLFTFHLMTSLIGGMAVFLIVKNLYGWLGTKTKKPHNFTVLIMSALTVLFLSLIGVAIYSGIHVEQSTFSNLSADVVNILQQLKNYLPASLLEYIPDDVIQLKEQISDLIKSNIPDMLILTSSSLKGFAHVIIGMLIGGIISFSSLKTNGEEQLGVLSKELLARINTFAEIFQKVIFAQIKISLINTSLTAFYLLIILPFLGLHVPYANMLVILTFMFGLLPVIGNLVTNSLITILSLTVSFKVAVFSLIFLIVVHKLEYYINAKIVGKQIKTSIWEILIVMVVLESIFGVIGVVLGPVLYGYLKEELKLSKVI